MATRLGKPVDMESRVIHAQLDNPVNIVETRRTLICYMQYLVDYRRDVPELEEYFVNEIQGLSSTKYVKQLQKDDPIYQIVCTAEGLDVADGDGNKIIWTTLKNYIFNL